MLSYNPVKGDDSFLYNDLPQCGMYNEDGTVNYQITRLYLLQLIDYFKRFHDYLSNPQWQSQIDLSMCYECINCDNMVENIHSMRTDPQFKNNIYMPLIRQFMRLREACLQKLNNMKQRYPSPLNTPYQSPLTPYQSPLDYDDYNDDPEAYHFGQDYWSNTIYDDQYPSYNDYYNNYYSNNPPPLGNINSNQNQGQGINNYIQGQGINNYVQGTYIQGQNYQDNSEYKSKLSFLKDMVNRLTSDRSTEQYRELLDYIQKYDDYESGISEIDVVQLMTLAKFFDVSVDYMAGVTTIRRPYPTE